MTGIHDRGGWPGAGPIERSDHDLADWELRTDAILRVLSSPDRRVMRVDELRRTIEGLDPARYESMRYYERWITAIEAVLIEKKILTRAEVDAKVADLEGGGR